MPDDLSHVQGDGYNTLASYFRFRLGLGHVKDSHLEKTWEKSDVFWQQPHLFQVLDQGKSFGRFMNDRRWVEIRHLVFT